MSHTIRTHPSAACLPVVLLVSLVALLPANAASLVIDGKPNCTIIVSPDATAGVRAAAEDLQYHLREMSGAEVPLAAGPAEAVGVKVWVGVTPPDFAAPEGVDLTDSEAFWPDGYFLGTSEQWGVVLLAPRPEGVANAVYGLLEDHLGCHWFAPGTIGECIPRNDDVELQLEGDYEVVRPTYEQRWPWYNGNALAGATEAEQVGMAQWRTRNRAGGMIGYTGHNWDNIYTLAMQQEDPDLAPEINGVRTPSGPEAQFCLSSPRAADIGARYFIDFFNRRPDHDHYSFSQNDSDIWCQCKRCQEYGENNAERMLKLTNEVARRVAEVHPDKYIVTLPYLAALEPPARDFAPDPNVVGVICSFTMEQILPKTADNRYTNAYRPRAEGWMQMLGAGWIYDYKGWYPGPWTIFSNVQTDHDYYRSIGAVGDLDEYLDRNLGTDIYQWLTFQTGWDAERKVADLLDVFYPTYFGAAAPQMRALYESFANHMMSQGSTGEIMDVPRLYPVKLVEDALDTIARAKEQVADDPTIVARLERDENCLQLTRLFLDFWSAAGAVRRTADPADLDRALKSGQSYASRVEELRGTLTVGYAAPKMVVAMLADFAGKGPHFDKQGEFAYSDILDEGGNSFLAKSRTGFRLGTYGLELAPGARGEVVFPVTVAEGLSFKAVRLARMYLDLPEGGHNGVEVSLDDGKTWQTAFSDTKWWGSTLEPDLTPLVGGSQGFLLKFWVQNSGQEILAMDNWGLKGEVE